VSNKNTIVINGKVYDALSGLPVAAPEPSVVEPTPQVDPPKVTDTTPAPMSRAKVHGHHATKAHHLTHKSATLRRDAVKKPASQAHSSLARHKPAAGHVARSPHIQRFAPHPQPLAKPSATHQDIVRTSKPHVSSLVSQKHALVTPASQVKPARLSSRALKEQLISERLAQVDTTKTAKHHAPKRRWFATRPRAASLVVVSLAVMVLGGYLTYLSMPGLSVRVAAAQAGVAASFPDYHPDGYSFDGPVAYAPGQVAIQFHANGGTKGYTVTQQKSSWDSQAVYDNVVASAGDDNYTTNSQQGLTIYTFKGKAAWVNKGILYTIDGDAPLSNQQLLRIAGSL